jgi:hypothetical protein
VVVPLGAAARYLPVGRCAAPRGWPARPRPAALPPRAAPWTGGGVRRTSSRRARSSGLSSVRVLSVLGCTVRNTGPRTRSTTATTTFELLGVSNTIPASPGPPSVSVTSSPAPIDSISASVPGTSRRGIRANGAARTRTPDLLGAMHRSARASRRCEVPFALERGFRAGRRRRADRRSGRVCLWCARGGLVPHSRRSRLTQPISGAGAGCQGPPARPRAKRVG